MAKRFSSLKLNQYEREQRDSAKMGLVITVMKAYVKIKDKASGECRFYPRPNDGDAQISEKTRCATATAAVDMSIKLEQQMAEEAAAKVKAAMAQPTAEVAA